MLTGETQREATFGGSAALSLRLASNVGDVERFIAFATQVYRDRDADVSGIAPRHVC